MSRPSQEVGLFKTVTTLLDERDRLKALNAELLHVVKAFVHIATVYPDTAQLMIEAGGPILIAAEHVIAKAEKS